MCMMNYDLPLHMAVHNIVDRVLLTHARISLLSCQSIIPSETTKQGMLLIHCMAEIITNAEVVLILALSCLRVEETGPGPC